jgi:hypothetical protein
LDDRLKKLWSQHPNFILVPHNPSFFKKISFGLAALDSIVSRFLKSQPKKTAPRKSGVSRKRGG